MNRKIYNILRELACFELGDTQASTLRETFEGFQRWKMLQADAELHALAPLVYRHFRENEFPCPPSFMLGMKALALRHRSATRIRYEVLGELLGELDGRGIEIIGIKGMALAPLIYPEPGFRPMRDMDILAPLPRIAEITDVMRRQGFDLPSRQPSRYEVLNHHLPNATRVVDGMTVSIEVHKDAVNNDSFTRITWDRGMGNNQSVSWGDIQFLTLGHELMLLQLCRHLAGTQSTLKLINVLDVVAYVDRFFDQIDWPELGRKQPFVINTLRCLHMVCPLSDRVATETGIKASVELEGVGENMKPVSQLMQGNQALKVRAGRLFYPSEWWMHLHYGVNPGHSLWPTRLITHPFYLVYWLGKRMASRVLWSKE